MRVLLSTYGSRGDVEPMVGLALALRALGAEAQVCAPPDFAGLRLDHPTGLVVTEAMPAVLAAIVAGLACALALPQLVGSALTLAVFTDSGTPVAIRPGWAALGLPAVAVIVIAAAALAGQTRGLRRRGVTGLLRAN